MFRAPLPIVRRYRPSPPRVHRTMVLGSRRLPRMLSGLLCLVSLLFSSLLTAADQRGLFWEVRQGENTAWVLGAVHTGKPDLYPLRRPIMDAFWNSRVLLVEMDEARVSAAEQQRILQRYSTYADDDRIQNHVSESTLRDLTEQFGRYDIPLQAVENRLPAFLALMLTSLQSNALGYLPQWGIDTHLLQAARSLPDPPEIRQIESYERQMALLAGLPQTEEILVDTLRDLEENPRLWQDIEMAWRTGDGELLEQRVLIDPLRKDPGQAPLYEAMFFSRNPGMAAALRDCMESGQRCFMVVGAGHLVGERGVLAVLRAAGYRVTQR